MARITEPMKIERIKRAVMEIDPYNRPKGCPFHPRCPQRIKGKCNQIHPNLVTLPDGRAVRCLLYGE